MRKKTKLYLVLSVSGALLAMLAVQLGDALPRTLGGMMMGVGSGLFAYGLSNWLNCFLEEKYPARMKQNQIEAGDERNVAIIRRAKAVSGQALQWIVMAAAMLSIGLEAPLWVTLAMIGAFVLKSLLELYLLARYQREM